MKPFKSFAGLRQEKPERNPLIQQPGLQLPPGRLEMLESVGLFSMMERRVTCSPVTAGVSRCGHHQTDSQTQRETRADKWTNGPDIPTLVGTEIQP